VPTSSAHAWAKACVVRRVLDVHDAVALAAVAQLLTDLALAA
jgi:hypothetical protein